MANGKAGAPIGNRNAVGHGRIPNPGFSEEEVIAMGEELLNWIEDNNTNDKIVHLSQWYYQVKHFTPNQWDALEQRDCFLPYLRKAKQWMGVRVLTNKKLSESYGNRFVGIYFKEVRDHERSNIEHKVDYEIKKKREADQSNSYPNDRINEAQMAWIKAQSAIEELQKKNKELEEKILASQSKAD